MSIRIKTEKIVERGIAKRRILEIEGLIDNEKCPKAYFEGTPYMKKYDYGCSIQYINDKGYYDVCSVCIGQTFEEGRWQKILELINKAGERLHKLRLEEKELREKWTGQETFII